MSLFVDFSVFSLLAIHRFSLNLIIFFAGFHAICLYRSQWLTPAFDSSSNRIVSHARFTIWTKNNGVTKTCGTIYHIFCVLLLSVSHWAMQTCSIYPEGGGGVRHTHRTQSHFSFVFKFFFHGKTVFFHIDAFNELMFVLSSYHVWLYRASAPIFHRFFFTALFSGVWLELHGCRGYRECYPNDECLLYVFHLKLRELWAIGNILSHRDSTRRTTKNIYYSSIPSGAATFEYRIINCINVEIIKIVWWLRWLVW